MTCKSIVPVLLSAALAAAWLPLTASPAAACPFCGSVQSTLAQDINSADVAAVATAGRPAACRRRAKTAS